MNTTTIIPIRVLPQGNIALSQPDKVEELTLKSLNITEAHLEEFVRENIGLLFPEGETLLIVGQQQQNQQGGRADLVAIDGEGSIVLIELKRDKDDIAARKEAFEFQAIRYAANYARINSPQELVQKIFAPYVERHKHKDEHSGTKGLTASEIATRALGDFLAENQAERNFNQRQVIVLIASSYDEQTLSACAWLAKNGIAIRCLSVSPIRHNQQHFFAVEQIIPPPLLDEYFVEIAEPSASTPKKQPGSSQISRQALPKMPKLFEWGLIFPGDKIYIKNKKSEIAEVVDNGFVLYQEARLTYNAWGQKVTGWSAINIYEWAVREGTDKTLDQLRREKQEELAQASVATVIVDDGAMPTAGDVPASA